VPSERANCHHPNRIARSPGAIPRLSTPRTDGVVRRHRRSWRRPFPARSGRLPGAVQAAAASL